MLINKKRDDFLYMLRKMKIGQFCVLTGEEFEFLFPITNKYSTAYDHFMSTVPYAKWGAWNVYYDGDAMQYAISKHPTGNKLTYKKPKPKYRFNLLTLIQIIIFITAIIIWGRKFI